MVAAVTNAIAGGTPSTTDGTSYPSASFTPVAGDLLVVGVQATGTAATAPTLTASANGLTFRLLTTFAIKNTSLDRQYVFVARQLVPSSPAAMTVTFACPADAATGAIISVARVSGMTNVDTAAVRQAAKVDNVLGGTAPQTVFPAPCLTTNPTLFFMHTTVGSGSTPPSGMTERVDATYSTPVAGGGYSSRDSGFTGTTLTLGSTTNGASSAIAIELDASAPATTFRGWGIPAKV